MNIEEDPRFQKLRPKERQWAKAEFFNPDASLDNILRPDFWGSRRRLRITSFHELGHAITAGANDWNVTAISVIAEGNTLGWTKSVPSRLDSGYRLLREKIAICFGGMMAEEKLGHKDHSGCGSDIQQAGHAARLLVMYFGGSEQSYLQEGRGNAAASVNNISFGDFDRNSDRLMENGIAA